MNLYQLIHTIKETSLKSTYVQEFKEGDVYENLNSGSHRYPTIVFTLDTINKDADSDASTISFNLFYIDRLEDDSSNKLQIQSFSVTVLSLILNQLEESLGIDFASKTFYPFTEKFADLCAGSYVTVSVDVILDSICDNTFEPKTLNIQSNGIYDVVGYDEANVDVDAADSIDYYWIMPHNYGVPQINYSDNTTTLEIKFRLKNTSNQSIYDDGYTSLIYEDDQYKARLNGGEWTETLIRETDNLEARTVKLTGTKLQIGYYLFDLEDGGHQWSYGQQLYIGKGENVGDIYIYNCKLYWDKGDFVDYEPSIVDGAACLEDKISGNIMNFENK